MQLSYRRTAKVGKNTRVNYSKTGASLSHRIGPFTINSRGHVRLRLGRGFSLRIL